VGVIANLPNRTAAVILGIFVFPFGARLRPPLDELGAQVARSMLDNGSMRLRLTQDIFSPDLGEEGLGQLEAALELVTKAREAHKKTRDAVSRGQLAKEPHHSLTERAVAKGIINAEEAKRLKIAARAQDAVLQVDSFTAASYSALKG
jgi:acyl-CoA dehydrogenase